MALVTGTAAGLYILGNKTREQAIKNRMLELWKDRSKPPGPQWRKVKRSTLDIGLEAAALKEAQRIWNLHNEDIKQSGKVRDDRKTFDTSADQIYVVRPGSEVRLDKRGNYTGRSGEWQELPIQPDGSRMTQLQFHKSFPQLFDHEGKGKEKNQEIKKSRLAIKNKKKNDVTLKDIPVLKDKKDEKRFLDGSTVKKVKEDKKAPLSLEEKLAQNLQGVGQRDFKKRDEATRKALKSSGYDTSGISSFDQSEFLRDLRIGHAWDTGKGTIMYKPNRGMMRIIQKKKQEA